MSNESTEKHPRTALSIAGLDPCGGAGILADVKTFEHAGVYGMGIATTLTFQNTREMKGRFDPGNKTVRRQLEVLLEDCRPDAIKVGALGNAFSEDGFFRVLSDNYEGPVVVDPVLKSAAGGVLDSSGCNDFIQRLLVPYASIVTPNIGEVADLWGFAVSTLNEMEKASRKIVEMGAKAVLITGFRYEDAGEISAVDLYCDGDSVIKFESPWFDCLNVHGTGCVLSSSITAYLALGKKLPVAVRFGLEAVRSAIENAVCIGSGSSCANSTVFPDCD
ncbi:MAG: bifunctional hydroxymethylpyrimidine kinase/phosphomethylpyrimidine kinase [Actinobacteria bacterium]|nr:bifunctional hydroxymethylpyrimidine kinase/phosphomethylpyrimidine kinase [Actinomycetota bacterium]